MLVLNRKVGEEIHLILEDGKVIRVKVVDERGRGVRLGIEAPAGVKVVRAELRGDVGGGRTEGEE